MIGNSVAYHLVQVLLVIHELYLLDNSLQRGWSDIVIIDKGGVADGTSRHGSGMLGLFRPKHERAIVQYCIDLYQSLQEQGYDLGLEHCGSINVASSKDRMTSIERRVSAYRPTGVECHLISPREMEQIHPHINTEDVVGGVWIPKDACVDAGKVSEVLAFLAHQGGAKFVSGCGVKRVLTDSSSHTSLPNDSTKGVRVSGVETELGHIK